MAMAFICLNGNAQAQNTAPGPRTSVEITEYEQRAAAGDGEAMRKLAQCYEQGTGGVSRDLKEAWKWYGLAAQEGDLEAEYNIGRLYRDGIGTKQNFVESAYWFRKAARNGHVTAMLNIARQFEEGKGVLQDYTIAAENYWKAADRGNAEAAYRYAEMCRDGIGVKADKAKAYKWFEKAAAAGYGDAAQQAELLKSYRKATPHRKSAGNSPKKAKRRK